MGIYTIEQHLVEKCKEDKRYELLKQIYDYNKPIICNGLGHISRYFTQYSKHDSSHSQKIITAIEQLLGEDKIKQLSATDTYLILMSAYLHDYSMTLNYKEIRALFESDKFVGFLKSLENNPDFSDDSKRLNIEELCQKYSSKKSWPLDILNSLNRVISAYYRTDHALNSKNIIYDNFTESDININPNKFLPERLEYILGEICRIHQADFKEIMKLEKVSNGSFNDKMHPRFIAVLLRIGDLLDLDNDRYDEALLKTACNELNRDSSLHYNKHKSIKEFLITEKLINIKSESINDDTVRLTREWKKWLEDELNNFSKYLNDIIPEDWIFSVPKLTFIVNKTNSEACYIDKNLMLEVSSEKAFDLISGAGIYKNNLAFIREYLQNAIDAVKIKSWMEVLELESYTREDFNLLSKENIKKIISDKYEKNEYSDVCKKFQIKIHFFDCNNDKEFTKFEEYYNSNNLKKDYFKNKIIVVFEDNGVGISKECLEKRILSAGEHNDKSDKYQRMIDTIPQIIKPTSKFGIGMHSAFLVSKYVIIQTKTVQDENGREIIINSTKNNGWVECNKLDKVKENELAYGNIGTRTYVVLDPNKIEVHIKKNGKRRKYPNKFIIDGNDSKDVGTIIKYIESIVEDVCIEPFCSVQLIDYPEGKLHKKYIANMNSKFKSISFNEIKENVFEYKNRKLLSNAIEFEFYNYYMIITLQCSSEHNDVYWNPNRTLILATNKETGHKLKFYISPQINYNKDVTILYKGMNVESLELKEELKKYLIDGSDAIIDYSFDNTSDYLKINRDDVTKKGLIECTKVFKEMISISLKAMRYFVMKMFEKENIIEKYNKYSNFLEPISEKLIISFAEWMKENTEHGEIKTEIVPKSINYYGDNNMGINNKDEAVLFLEVFTKRIGQKLWNIYNSSSRIFCVESYFEKGEVKEKFYSYIANYLSNLNERIELLQFINEFDKFDMKSVEEILKSFSDEIGADALQFLRPNIRTNTLRGNDFSGPFKKFYSSLPILMIFRYHQKYGHQDILNDNKYIEIVSILTDEYIKNHDYGYFTDEECNQCGCFAFYKDKPLHFGRELIKNFTDVYYQWTTLEDKDNSFLISIYPIKTLDLYFGDSKKWKTKMENVDKGCEEISCSDGVLNLYFFADIIKFDYVDVEEKDYVISEDLDNYCIPAVKKYSSIAIENIPIEYEMFYKNSKFRNINQGKFIIFPTNSKLLEKWIEIVKNLSYEYGMIKDENREEFDKEIQKEKRQFIKGIYLNEIVDYTYKQNSKEKEEINKEYKLLLEDILNNIYNFMID
ncbi:HD domain-containing protein [Clostridium uliginosum]|uniref:Histidine kinase-, DNA gyrase B-, and HSP90-like ATPase n=1 Tax=Clostridium uliginosum TaxID=119641 RepID=A0A1I1NPA9_9CLOT|nr:ATP-binding protein [Clostridium uliginosum]SFC97328.1 Histidine kinase-, DNA gyrase B-, and HSP90-like ATPase [Clostridium uliginosum]